MSDDELRRRLRDIPAPRAAIDADAVIERAKRRRRPKTIALSSAATVASVLIIAPLVVPGLQLPHPASQTATDSGAGAESAEQPASGVEASEESRPLDASEDAGAEDAGDGDTGAAGGAEESALLCGLPLASSIGLELEFAEPPTDGPAPVIVRTAGGEAARLEIVEAASIDVIGSTARVAAGASSEELALAEEETAQLEVPAAVLEAGACGEGAPSGPAPVAIIGRGGVPPTAVVGTPWR